MCEEPSIKYAQYTPPARCRECAGLYGLLHYRKWWERNEVDISVCGKLISGTPIFIEENTLRVVNRQYSYFIPMEKIDFIRTTDGLCSGFQLLE